jgi:hypothetical protein
MSIATDAGLSFAVLLTEDRQHPPSEAFTRLLRDIAAGRVLGDTTTLADPAVVQDLKDQYEEKGATE